VADLSTCRHVIQCQASQPDDSTIYHDSDDIFTTFTTYDGALALQIKRSYQNAYIAKAVWTIFNLSPPGRLRDVAVGQGERFSTKDFQEGNGAGIPPDLTAALPQGCYLDADTQVQRIWDNEIRRVLTGVPKTERLKSIFQEIMNDLDQDNPSLLDVMNNAYDLDPYELIKQFNGWLRAKQACGANLTEYETRLLDTEGERFLIYIETQNMTRSYKMIVLMALLEMPGTEWAIEDIARRFLAYFIEHPEHRFDYKELAESGIQAIQGHIETEKHAAEVFEQQGGGLFCFG